MMYLKTNFIDSDFRMNFALMTGTYSIDNYADEPALFQNLLEGNIGFKLSKKSNTWLDIGVIPSHLGFESAIGYDCWNVSRSLLSENSPYFQTGAKLTHISKNEKWSQSYLVLNGWQRITMIPGHSVPAVGTQFIYKPSTKLMLNYSNFIGTTRPDSNLSIRMYNDFFATYAFNEKWTGLVYFDIGMDKTALEDYAYWYGANLSLRYSYNTKNTFCLRTEIFNDPNDVLYPQLNYNWYAITSSINWDYKIKKYALVRAELKYMQSNQTIFLPQSDNHLGAFVALQVKL
jgi:hypothetical protein